MKSFSLYCRMLKYLKGYWHLLLMSLGLSLFVVIFEALSLWFGVSLIQTLFNPPKELLTRPEFSVANVNALLKYYTYLAIYRDDVLESLKIVCTLMASTFLLKNILIYFKTLVMTRLNLVIIRDMRNDLFQHVLRLPISFYDRNKSGDIISLVVNDIQSVNASMTGTFDKLFTEPMRVFFFVVTLFVINFQLTLAVFILFPILGFVISVVGKAVRRRSKRVLEYMAGILSILHEVIGGVRAVKMFNMNEKESERFGKENDRFIESSYRSTSVGAISSPLTEILGVVAVIVLLWYGGKQVLSSGGFGAEDFLRFLIFLFSTFTPLKALSGINNTLQRGFAAAERVFMVLDAPIETLVTFSSARKPCFEKSIEFRNVNFSYPGCNDQVLHDITFTIPKGSVVALVGSSGSGKSTILDLLPRFYDIQSGSICIDNTDVGEIDLVGLRSLFGIVAQETFLFNETVFNNISYGFQNYSFEEVKAAAQAANALEFIDRLPKGFETVIGERGVMLSGGQRQRLSIARAILRNPLILILDEATSALDTESERLVQSAIANLMTERTALVVAHRLSTIKHADTIIVLDNGKISEQGNHDELLLLNKRYRYFYDIQFSATKEV